MVLAMRSAARPLLLVALMASGASLHVTPVLAEGVPQPLIAATGKIERLTPEQARELVTSHKGKPLVLMSLTSLDADVAKAVAEFKGWLHLPALTTIDADAAAALAASKAQTLFLNGLTTLSPDAARALAGYRGGLCLNGLPTLSADAARELAAFKGRALVVNGLASLDADAAATLAAVEQWDGQLPCVTAFEAPDSIAVARALAARPGPLALPNLEKLSPKTLAALLEKHDVEIPAIDSLELIPEPDGSPTDDFVIPDGFQQRQQAAKKKRKMLPRLPGKVKVGGFQPAEE